MDLWLERLAIRQGGQIPDRLDKSNTLQSGLSDEHILEAHDYYPKANHSGGGAEMDSNWSERSQQMTVISPHYRRESRLGRIFSFWGSNLGIRIILVRVWKSDGFSCGTESGIRVRCRRRQSRRKEVTYPGSG